MKHVLRVILLITLSLAIFTASAQSEYYDDSGAASTRNPYYQNNSNSEFKALDSILSKGFKIRREQLKSIPDYLTDITGGTESKYDYEIPGIYGSTMSGEDINDLRRQARKNKIKNSLEKITYWAFILCPMLLLIWLFCKGVLNGKNKPQTKECESLTCTTIDSDKKTTHNLIEPISIDKGSNSSIEDTLCNKIKLIEDNIKLITLPNFHNMGQDDRLLIPFSKHGKYGLINRNYEIVLPAKFDTIKGECISSDDLLVIGKENIKIYGDIDNPRIYKHTVLGVVDSNGKILLDPNFWTIFISDDRQRITVVDYETRQHAVLDRAGNVIVPYGKYSYIDGFDHGLARVKSQDNDRWGLIDINGKVVLPIEYNRIWNFYEKNRTSTMLVKDGKERIVSFSALLAMPRIEKND